MTRRRQIFSGIAALLLLLAPLVGVAPRAGAVAAWQPFGPGTITQEGINTPRIDITSNGVPIVAYADDKNTPHDDSDDQLIVKRFNGTSWELVGGSAVPSATPFATGLKIAPNGDIYVGYSDSSHARKITVQKYTGSSWSVVGSAGFSLGQPEGVEFAFDADGLPYVGYSYIDLVNGEKPAVHHFDGSTWNVVGVSDIADWQPSTYVDITTDSAGTPFITYYDVDFASKIMVKRFDGTSWVDVGDGTGISSGLSLNQGIAMSSDDIPYVAFTDFGDGNKVSVKRYVGGNWEFVGSQGFTVTRSFEGNLRLTSKDVPIFAYQDYDNNRRTTVQRFDGTNWTLLGGVVSPDFGFIPGMAIDNRDVPYVIYGDVADSGKLAIQRLMGGEDELSDPSSTIVTSQENATDIAVQSGYGTALTCANSTKEGSLNQIDAGYSYPLGLVNFCFTTDFVSNVVTVTFITDLEPQQVVVRKYSATNGGYTTVNDAVINKTDLNGKAALAISYTIIDNGPLDDNPVAGAITDPVGIAAAVTAPNTGYQSAWPALISTSSAFMGGVAIMSLLVGRQLFARQRRQYNTGA